MKVAIFLVALVAASVRASPLEGRPLKDDAEDYSIGFAADYDMSGDEEEWGGVSGERRAFRVLLPGGEGAAGEQIHFSDTSNRFRRHITPGMKQQLSLQARLKIPVLRIL